MLFALPVVAGPRDREPDCSAAAWRWLLKRQWPQKEWQITMGDKGGKKDKEKNKQQLAHKTQQKAQQKHENDPVSAAAAKPPSTARGARRG